LCRAKVGGNKSISAPLGKYVGGSVPSGFAPMVNSKNLIAKTYAKRNIIIPYDQFVHK